MQKLEANFSVLIMSLASSAAMALGLAPHPETGKTQKDKNIAKFNIDLLIMLKDKTLGNLSQDELRLLENIISDLQMKYISDK